jgi:hypothetical protein
MSDSVGVGLYIRGSKAASAFPRSERGWTEILPFVTKKERSGGPPFCTTQRCFTNTPSAILTLAEFVRDILRLPKTAA